MRQTSSQIIYCVHLIFYMERLSHPERAGKEANELPMKATMGAIDIGVYACHALELTYHFISNSFDRMYSTSSSVLLNDCRLEQKRPQSV